MENMASKNKKKPKRKPTVSMKTSFPNFGLKHKILGNIQGVVTLGVSCLVGT